MPRVRNVKLAYKYDHNVWISHATKDPWGKIIRQASPFAVPYEMRVRNKDDVDERKAMLKAYKAWLWSKMNHKNENVRLVFWNALRQINEQSVLLCYCDNGERCHGEVVRDAWIWAKNKGLLDHVTTPHTSDKTLKTVAKAVVKTTEKERVKAETVTHPDPATLYATGPLDMPTIMAHMRASLLAEQADRQRIDTHLDEQLLAEHVTTCPDCDAPKYIHLAHHHEGCSCEDCHHNALAKTLPPRKKQGRGAPRKPKGIVYSVADPMYNRLDDIEADLAELTTLREYLSTTHTDANAPALHATA